MRIDSRDHGSPDQRLDDLSAILAEGITRLFALRIDVIQTPSDASNSAQNSVDVCPQKSVHGPRSVNRNGEPR
jgi:hypothetical protein